MQPVFDIKAGKKVNLKAKNNWLCKMIQKDSCLEHL